MKAADFSEKKVALAGAGKENLGLVPHLLRWGARVVVLDKELDPEINRQLQGQKIEFRTGVDYLENLSEYDYVFRSPGMPVETINGAVRRLQIKPVVTSATNLFLSICPGRVIGVTGTKGKGTTANYLYSILRQSRKDAQLVGNIGRSAFDVLDQLTPESFVIMELSSFQLEDARVSPSVSVLLPITADHLQPLSKKSPNFHPSVEAYRAAKSSITKYQGKDGLVVFSADSAASCQIARMSAGRQIGVSLRDRSSNYYVSPSGELFRQTVSLGRLPENIGGDHLRLDAALASATAIELGFAKNWVTGLQKAVALPHRMQEVAVKRGVRYVDDSYATAPDAAAAALSAFPDKSVIWIGGGSRKGADFSLLAAPLSKKVKVAILIGQEAPRLSEMIGRIPEERPEVILDCQTMREAVARASSLARANDTVLLSPACASKDMFASAAERGEEFTRAVNEL